MKTSYSRFTLSERREIERWRLARISDPEIPSVSGYWGMLAQTFSVERRCRQRKLVRHP